MDKTCIKCHTPKSTLEFGIDRTRSDGLNYECLKCRRERSAKLRKEKPEIVKKASAAWHEANYESNKEAGRRYYAKDKAGYKARQDKRKVPKWRAYQASKQGLSCMDCKQPFPYYCLDYDHRDPKTKVAGVSTLIYRDKEKYVEEIKKCDLVCTNCHRKRTHARSDCKPGCICKT